MNTTTTTNAVQTLTSKEKSAITRALTAQKVAALSSQTIVALATLLQADIDRVKNTGTTAQKNTAENRENATKAFLARKAITCGNVKARAARAVSGGTGGFNEARKNLKTLFDVAYKAALENSGVSSEGANFGTFNFRLSVKLAFTGRMTVVLTISENSQELSKEIALNCTKAGAIEVLLGKVRAALFPAQAAMLGAEVAEVVA